MMNQSLGLVIAIVVVLMMIGVVVYVMLRSPALVRASLLQSKLFNHKEVMKYVKEKNIKLNHPDNLLYPDVLAKLPASMLPKITPETLYDTNVIVNMFSSQIQLNLEQLKVLTVAQIMAMNPFQMASLDDMYKGDGTYAGLQGVLSPEPLMAFVNKMNPASN